jgi:hypothetical protein
VLTSMLLQMSPYGARALTITIQSLNVALSMTVMTSQHMAVGWRAGWGAAAAAARQATASQAHGLGSAYLAAASAKAFQVGA